MLISAVDALLASARLAVETVGINSNNKFNGPP